MTTDTFKMTPVSLGALIGGVVAFIAVGAITAVLWVVLGVAIGAGIGFGIRHLGQRMGSADGQAARAGDFVDQSRDELYRQAQDLEVPGRSSMTREELAEAIAAHAPPTTS